MQQTGSARDCELAAPAPTQVKRVGDIVIEDGDTTEQENSAPGPIPSTEDLWSSKW